MTWKKSQETIVFAYAALNPMPAADQMKNRFSAWNAKTGLTKIALEASYYASAIIAYQIRLRFFTNFKTNDLIIML